KRSGTTKYNNGDFLGSFTRQTDSNQATSGTRSYDAFGLPTGTTQSPTGPFGFAGGWGYQEDGDYGVKLLGHRYYDGSTGRFLTRDPIQDGRNWYAYCESNPLRFIDPNGKQFLATIAADRSHAWIIFDDIWGNSVTYGLWPNKWLQVDAEKGRPPEASRSIIVDKRLISKSDDYNFLTNNCTNFAQISWEAMTGEDFSRSFVVETPWRLRDVIRKKYPRYDRAFWTGMRVTLAVTPL
ncbi:MAG: RHS repeat-associated core domain-containing protein, partial [Fimbriimonadaceae bacterium]